VNGGFEGGEVAGGVDHAVLGGEADRRGGRGQDAQVGGVAQPQARPVRREPAGGHGANAGERTVRARTHRAAL
jgi:hypothetical protein